MGSPDEKTKHQILKEIDELKAKLAELEKSKANNQSDNYNESSWKDALAVSEKQYRLMIKNMLNGYAFHQIVLDDKGTPIDYIFLDVNSGFEQMTGLKKEDILGKKTTEVIPLIANDPANWIGRYGNVAKNGKDIKFESYAETLQKWFSVYAYCPEIGYFVTFFEDISGQKEADVELKKYKALHEHTEKAAKIGGWTFDLETLDQTWSDEIFRILEVDLSHGAPKVPEGLEFIDQPYRQMAEEALQRAIELGEPYDQNWVVTTTKGNKRWVNAVASPELKNGKTVQIAGSFQDISERKKAEENLENAKELLNNTEKTAKIGGWKFDVKTLKQKWTEEVYRIHEVDSTFEPTVSNGIGFYAPSSRPIIEKAVNEAIEKSKPFDVELEIITAKGNTKWVHAVANPEIENGKTINISGSFQEITERKKAELELIAAEKKTREIFNNLNAGIVVHDSTTKIILNNNKAIELLGLSEDQLRGKVATDPAWMFVDENNDPIPTDNFPVNRVINTKLPLVNMLLGVIQPNKKDIVWLIVNGFPFFNENGQIEEVIISFIDITERKKAEKELFFSEEIFRHFMERSPIYIFFKDENIRSLRLSKNFESMLNKPLSELLNKNMDELFPSDLAKSMIEDDKRILFGNEKVTVEEEFNNRNYNTIKFPIHIEGKPTYLAGYTIDITERKKIEAELKKYRENLEEMVKQRTLELEEKNKKLDDAMKAFVGREITIRNLQERIKVLEGK
jgi:PAS domain S-box-containing protein